MRLRLFPKEASMAGSCGAFCAFCGKCGREIPEFMRSNKPENVPPPGEALKPSAEGASAHKADIAELTEPGETSA